MSQRRLSEQRPEQRSHLSCPPPQWLAKPKSTERTEARAPTSSVVPATTVAGRAQAYQAIRGQSSALTCRARHHRGCLRPRRPTNIGHRIAFTCRAHHHSGWLSPRLPSVLTPEQRPMLSCPPTKWLGEPTTTLRTEATATPSIVAPATTMARLANADRAKSGHSSAIKCSRHNSSWLSPRRPSEHMTEQRSHLPCPPPQWLAEPTPTDRTEAR